MAKQKTDQELMEIELAKRKADQATEEEKHTALEFIDHLNDCEDGSDCVLGKAKSKIETEAFLLGYLARDQID